VNPYLPLLLIWGEELGREWHQKKKRPTSTGGRSWPLIGSNQTSDEASWLEMIANAKRENICTIVSFERASCLSWAGRIKVEVGAVVFPFTEHRNIIGH
jgi:hypothetical protein